MLFVLVLGSPWESAQAMGGLELLASRGWHSFLLVGNAASLFFDGLIQAHRKQTNALTAFCL